MNIHFKNKIMNKNWKTALAAMGIVPKQKEPVKMLFEIDGANGEKLSFTDANDITEIKEGSAVVAEDGAHTFVADGKTYNIEVAGGVVTKLEIIEETTDPTTDPALAEVLQEVANELQVSETERAEMKAEISGLKTTISEMKALMVHGKDDKKEPIKNTNPMLKVR